MDEAVVAGGETPGGLPWQLTVRLNRERHRAIDLQVGPTGGAVEGPPLALKQPVGICMIGGLDEQYIVGELAPAVERVRVRLDDDSEVDAEIVRSNLGEVDYFVAFAFGTHELTEARAFDHLGQLLGVEKRSERAIEIWRDMRLRRTKR